MAHGYGSVHPRTAALLKELGVTDGQITQGYGKASASAGYHLAEGRTAEPPAGHPYSSCVDLDYGLAWEPGFLGRLSMAGIAGFVRDTGSFTDNHHIHCVHPGLRDWDGAVVIHAGPRTQLIDYIYGRSGLVGHALIQGRWAPTPAQRATIEAAYAAWAPHVATRVYAPDGTWVPCYAFFELGAVRCEARPLLEALGATVGWDGQQLVATHEGRTLDLSTARLRLAVDFTRGDVRALAEALGYTVKFVWAPDKTSAEVRLSK
jgi:hypothetical protein